MRQAFLPVLRQPLAVLVQGVHVTGQGQGDHVGLQPVNHRTRLLARAAVRLFDAHVLPGFGLPVLDESSVELGIELTRRVVRHIEQRQRRLGGSAQNSDQGELGKIAACAHV